MTGIQGQRRPDTFKSHTRDCHASWKSLNFSVGWKNPEVFEGALVSEDIVGPDRAWDQHCELDQKRPCGPLPIL